ncbi:hypothetical protein NDR87_20020 [Nocardia sp. CDC159]|uniref:DUF8020 domain-containing protein n=1 Tax=Nocardia pulmonis TaxID=2951408 RepID=A0A9X2IXH6_9NOCA|nr:MULTISPECIES: hypothetical protein [Nocardia]MCM6776017.1 hypothetical protein [Nocardia pulmonis]MCM6788656.1 hypothetical protein [Nocardia sp. CDC159]
MLMRRFAATAAMTIAALGVTAGAVHANPTDTDAVNVKATTEDSSAIIRTDAGSMVVEDGVFKIKAANGTVLTGTDLKFRVDDFEFPIAADIKDRTATLTPRFDAEHAVYKPVALPFEDQAPWKTPYDREQAAWSRLTSTISMGATIGTVVGGLGAGAVGCILGGAVVASGATLATGVIGALFAFLPAAAVGCLFGAASLGALGVLAGQLLITAPVAIAAAVQYFTTINQPFTPPAK